MHYDAPELTLTAYMQLKVGDGASGSGSMQVKFAVSDLLIFSLTASYAYLLCLTV